MNCMSKAAGDPKRAVNGLLSIAQLLEEPRLAHLYLFVLQAGTGRVPRGLTPERFTCHRQRIARLKS